MEPRPRKRSPATFRRKRSALAWFVLCLLILGAAGWGFRQFVIQFNFESYTDSSAPLAPFLPADGYAESSYPPRADPYLSTPTPQPLLAPTPIPIERLAMLNPRLQMPSNANVVYCGLISCASSSADNNLVLCARGWGYLEGLDAAKSKVYLVVSTLYGDTHRFYLATREAGSTNIIHDPKTGTNLDQADFSAYIRIESTYIESDYRLGVMVVNQDGKNQTQGYARLDPQYNFTVQAGRITALGGVSVS